MSAFRLFVLAATWSLSGCYREDPDEVDPDRISADCSTRVVITEPMQRREPLGSEYGTALETACGPTSLQSSFRLELAPGAYRVAVESPRSLLLWVTTGLPDSPLCLEELACSPSTSGTSQVNHALPGGGNWPESVERAELAIEVTDGPVSPELAQSGGAPRSDVFMVNVGMTDSVEGDEVFLIVTNEPP